MSSDKQMSDYTIAQDELNDGNENDESDYCHTCHNTGIIITCLDDMCANSEYCIHGDGEQICPDCDSY